MPDYRRSLRPFQNADGGHISSWWRLIYRKVYVCQLWFTCYKYTLKYAILDKNGDHFLIQDGGQISCG